MELRFGEGGDDSKLFVDEMFAAYTKYARSLGLTVELLHSDFGHISAKIHGSRAGLAFQHEPGKHCCQRIPVTESNGRKHTSIISVAVLPIKEDTWEPLSDADLRTDTFRGRGPGGQHRNMTDSAVRITHIPTGLSVVIDGRDQHFNRQQARRILTAKVNEARKEKADVDYSAYRREQLQGGHRSGKVRTYNFMEGRVVDHRLGVKTSNVKAIIPKGQFGKILPA